MKSIIKELENEIKELTEMLIKHTGSHNKKMAILKLISVKSVLKNIEEKKIKDMYGDEKKKNEIWKK